ncbi:SPOR domain-containing protein [Falsirhodobacter sp. alg1]|uniref:SPOR domain-containing protein n=1 Tax=Falsirhodobacter sp. alg1 TaxID=1472418 RepID=UPI0005F0025D|nr:SPOR domain-containing protein [Falsirhodobacter sp. alg1]
MAEVDFDEFGAADYNTRRGVHMQRIINVAGAVSSVALVATLAWWGYHTTVRDVRGIPVVKALEGPMRVAPDDPGGVIAANQGLSVNEIAATGTSGDFPDELRLAPGAAELDLGDGPGLDGVEASPEVMAAIAEASGVAGSVTLPAKLPSSDPLSAGPDTDEEGLAQTVTGDPIDEISVPAPSIDPTLIPPELMHAEVVPPAPAGAVTRSPRPPLRSGRLASATPAAASAPAPVTHEAASSTLPKGANLVQLGAFDNEDQVRTEWARLSAKFGSLITDKTLVVQKAVSNGRTFYRLRAAGFEDASDSRRFCSAMLAENAACIPTVNP